MADESPGDGTPITAELQEIDHIRLNRDSRMRFCKTGAGRRCSNLERLAVEGLRNSYDSGRVRPPFAATSAVMVHSRAARP
jgi:hypothetical protein